MDMIRARASDKMFTKFETQIMSIENISREQFVGVYVQTFVPTEGFTSKALKAGIKGTSLIDTETNFLIACVNLEAKSVQDYIDLYNTFEKLPRCQLGELCLRCLEAFKNITF